MLMISSRGRPWVGRVIAVGVVTLCTIAASSAPVLEEDTSDRNAALADETPVGHREPLATAAEQECERMTAEQALDAVRQRYMDAFNRGDAEAVVALHTAESVSMPAGRPSVMGRDSIRDLLQESLSHAPDGFRFEFEPVELRVADGWAVERGVTKGGGPVPSGKYVMLYEREADGCWRIAWTITNTDAPPPPR